MRSSLGEAGLQVQRHPLRIGSAIHGPAAIPACSFQPKGSVASKLGWGTGWRVSTRSPARLDRGRQAQLSSEPIHRSGPSHADPHIHQGDFIVSQSLLFKAAAAAVATAAPGHAAAPQLLGAVQAAAPAAAAPKTPTRADIVRNSQASFTEVDANKDGSLSKAEVDAAQARNQERARTQIAQRVEQEFTRLDTDKNGQLSRVEFRGAAPAVRANPGAGAAVIQRLDANKDGKISAEEFSAPLLAGFDRVDTDKNGTISDAERKAASARTASR
jgi:hypothetical protein